MATDAGSVTSALAALLRADLARSGGWMPFDRFMAFVLYAPGLGYYAHGSRKFGTMPSSGSDFVTAPELTPLFGRALARQVAQALEVTGTQEVWEFGAGSGALAHDLLEALGDRVARYTIVDLSGSLRARQRERLAAFGDRVQWVAEWPDTLRGVVVGNEVLDAMPVKLLHRRGGAWHERGVAWDGAAFAFEDRATDLRPPVEVAGEHDYLTEIHPQAQAFVRSLADRLQAGAAFFIDYGFPESEYWHAQRHMGTVMCHRGHLADTNPLADIGLKDITAHVDFTGIAVAAQEAGLSVLGYTTQARFLFNCGLLELAANGTPQQNAAMQKLVQEHEMGELFKVIGLAAGGFFDALGFAQGDRTHTL
ncbi:class I SAM-dependent methyltransferase [Ramlibacter algicola]|uniref:SAM-dependent methyltransferase n=1 Tax=Ramlibacter algicola TaxID=2795217 RepID=A0A934UTG1_9BURK|nr:SAM-dependent methyltransferase [Ramlibacter algicola]MBK0394733.1 SAM-dependent methyltransferase [Ramlibacter algicola]